MFMSIDVAGIICYDCGSVNPPAGDNDFRSFFEDSLWTCVSCFTKVSLWEILFLHIRNVHPLMPGIVALGLGSVKHLQEVLEPDQTLFIDLDEHGIPEDATVIDVFITPQMNPDDPHVFPALGVQRLSARALPHVVPILPSRQWITDSEATPMATHLSIMVIWLPSPSEPEQEPLYSAATSFSNGDFRGSIIPAQIAFEMKLNKILSAHYANFGNTNEVNSFLTSGATYGYQLRFILPSLLQFTEAPPMPESLKDALKALNKKRNKVGHEHHETSREEACKMLLASVFGYRYLSIYGHLTASESNDK